MANTCEVPDEIKQEFKKFKNNKKTNCGVIMKINKEKLQVEIDQNLEEVSLEQIAENLPESAPRYIAYSYKYTHEDGRVSMPLVFIYYCPSDINPILNMMYSSTKTRLITSLEVMKSFDVQDSTQLTEGWLKEKLKFFK